MQIRQSLFFLLAVLVLPLFIPSAGMTEEVRPVVKLTFESRTNPPRYLGEGLHINWDKPGLTLELLRLVERERGIQFQYHRTPWNRGLELIRSGLADGIFHASYKPERAQHSVYPMKNGKLDPERSIFDQSYVLYVTKNSPLRWDGTSLTGLTGKIGYTLGYSIGDDLTQMSIPTEPGRSQRINLQKLKTGRIAAYAGLDRMVDYLLDKNPELYKQIAKLPIPVRTKPYYLIFRKEFYAANQELVESIWDSIGTLKQSDEYAQITSRYMQ